MRQSWVLLGVVIAAPALAVATPASDFAPQPLPGTRASLDPYLAGSVVYDRVVPFAPTAGTAGPRGTVQVRILKRASGTLDFYWRITNDAGSTAPITTAQVRGFPQIGYDANWRIDGASGVAPQTIAGAINQNVWVLAFQFGQPIAPGQSSRFFFISSGYHSWVPDPHSWLRIRSPGTAGLDVPTPLPRP